jgi:hypothetical protein
VQEGNRLHFLADRAGFNGLFSEMQARDLEEAFPHFVAHMELMLLSGELNPGACTASHCTVTSWPVKPIRWVVMGMYISQFIPQNRLKTDFSLIPAS